MLIRIVDRLNISYALKEFGTTPDIIDMTLDEYLGRHVRKYCGELKGFTVLADGITIPSSIFKQFNIKNTKYLTFIKEPEATAFMVGMLLLSVAVAIYTYVQMRKLKTKGTDSGKQASSIYDVNAQGNQIRLEDVIPEQFGLVKAFPDYASDKHYYYVNNSRYMDVLLCQGVGSYNHSLDKMYIGATPLSSYVGNDIDIFIAEPGEDISSHPAHRCWFNSTEVDISGKEVPAVDMSTSRKRGDKIITPIHFHADYVIDVTTTGINLLNGDYIRISGAIGADLPVDTKSAFEQVISGTRIYVNRFPASEEEMAYAISHNAYLEVGKNGSYVSSTVGIANFGSSPSKGNFIDITSYEIPWNDPDYIKLVIKNWAFEGESITSQHLNGNGYYRVITHSGNTCTVIAVNKKGVKYEDDTQWNGFLVDRTSPQCTIELIVDGMNDSYTSSKVNYAGYYRACPIGATSRYYEVDLDFPAGLYTMSDEGDYEDRTATITIDYRIAGSNDTPKSIVKTWTKHTPDEFAETVEIDVGDSLNAYEFRITNNSEYTNEAKVQQTFNWNGLKCLIAEKSVYEGVTMICMTVKGSQSLSELTNNQISTIWERRLSLLKEEQSIVESKEDVTGWNVYSPSGEEFVQMVLNSKVYNTLWDKVPDNYDAGNLKKYVKTGKRNVEIHHTKYIYDDDSGVYLYPLSKDAYGLNRYPSDTWEMSFEIDCIDSPLISSGSYSTYQKCALILGMASGTSGNRTSPAGYQAYDMCQIENPSSRKDLLAIWYKRICTHISDKGGNGDVEIIIPSASFDYEIGIQNMGYSIASSSYYEERHSMFYKRAFCGSNIAALHGFYPRQIKLIKSETSLILNIDGKHAFTVTKKEFPQIEQLGSEFAFVYCPGYNHTDGDLLIRNFTFKQPTTLTIAKYKQPEKSSLNVDKEANRALAPVIKYICNTSKFGSGMYSPENLVTFDRYWRKKNYYFDFRFDTPTTILEAIEQVTQTGLSETTVFGNQIRVVRKERHAKIVQMFTASNITGDPQITYNMLTPDDNNEIDCKYMSPTTWKTDEIYVTIDDNNNGVINNYPTSDKEESVEVLAVTSSDRAYDIAVRRLRELLFCRREISFKTELDALNCQYGDLIAVALPQSMANQSGRILNIDRETLKITLSDGLPEGLGAGVIYIKKPDGSSMQTTVIDNDGEYYIGVYPDFEMDFSSTDTMPIYAIGDVTKWWVTSIKPAENGTGCTVTAVAYDERVWGNLPEFGYGEGGYGVQPYGSVYVE